MEEHTLPYVGYRRSGKPQIFMVLLLFPHSVRDHGDYSSDRERLGIVKETLRKVIGHEDLAKACLLVYANKQDVKGAMTAAEISNDLDLVSIKSHRWQIQSCCALTGEGVQSGLEWIASNIA